MSFDEMFAERNRWLRATYPNAIWWYGSEGDPCRVLGTRGETHIIFEHIPYPVIYWEEGDLLYAELGPPESPSAHYGRKKYSAFKTVGKLVRDENGVARQEREPFDGWL